MNKSSLVHKEKNKLVLNQTALNKIKSIEDRIAVCSINGSYRSGKSTILNHLSQLFSERNGLKFDKSQSSFEIGHTEKACTKGLNICESIPKVKNHSGESIRLLFIDTEGLDSDDSKEADDVKIFLASLLISSVFMFNGLKTLNKQDFNRLSLVTTLSEKLKVKKNMAQRLNKKELKNELPDFIWLVRDFGLVLETNKDDYLKGFLEFEDYSNDDPKKKSEIDSRNQIKENLIDSFRKIDCSLLKQPVFGEEKLQRLHEIDLYDLRKEYLKDLNELVDLVNLILRPKEINGQKMNGPLFAEYLKLIVEAINSDKTIFLYETMSLALNALADQNLNECLDLFDKNIDPLFLLNSPIKHSELESKLKESKEKSLINLTSFSNLINDKTLFDEYKTKLEKKLDEKCHKLRDDNIKRVKEKDFNLALDHWKSIFKDVKFEEKYRMVDEFQKEVDNFKRDFTQNKLFDVNYKAHLDERFFNEVLNHSSINVYGLKEKIIEKESQREKERLQQLERERKQERQYNNHTDLFTNMLKLTDIVSPRSTCWSATESYTEDSYNQVGTVNGGKNHGKPVFQGPRGGLFFFNDNGNKTFIKSDKVSFW